MSMREDGPRRLDLDQQKKQAKELRRALSAGDAQAWALLRLHHPRPDSIAEAKLADAQLVIARILGLPSWPKLVAHVAALDCARADIAAQGPAPDGDLPTLHLRCGSDIRSILSAAGFAGDFLEVSDPYCQGPVPRDGDLMAVRAGFVSAAYGLALADATLRLSAEYEGLARAGENHARLVLWFEHDSYDQLILARVLAALAERRARPRVELICIDRFPAVGRFRGLGQLPPAELRSLWASRMPVTRSHHALGTAVWTAFREPSPLALHAIAASGTPELPEMAGALRRHLRELPWTGDGLSLTQRLSLEALKDGTRTASQVFRHLSEETEPLPFLGDLMLWAVLEDLARGGRPALEIDPATAALPWPQRRLALTATGGALLAGQADWQGCAPPERWVGGVRAGWRWSERDGRPVSD